jgi:hypothetical protein
MVEASYVGNYGAGNEMNVDINAIKPGTISETMNIACSTASNCNFNDPTGTNNNGNPGIAGWPTNWYRPRLNYQAINDTTVGNPTQYDSLQLSAHRSSGILFLLTNFGWSKSYSVNETASSLPDYGNNEYWGISSNNRKFTFNATYTLTEPKFNLSHTMDRIANGWQLSGITQWSSGPNLTSNAGANYGYSYGNDGVITTGVNGGNEVYSATHDTINAIGADQATLFATMVCNPATHKNNVTVGTGGSAETGVLFLKQACFAPTTQGLGSTHTAYWPGPAYNDTDLGIMKTVKINERQNVQIKAQAFDFLNHGLWSFNGGDGNLPVSFNGSQVTNGVVTQVGGSWSRTQPFGLATLRTGHRTVQLEARYWF